jgi:hypothetical protein
MPTLVPLMSLIQFVPPHRVVTGKPSPWPPSAPCLTGRLPLCSVTSRFAGLPRHRSSLQSATVHTMVPPARKPEASPKNEGNI